MKLSFKQNLIPEDLYNELDFNSYIDLFENGIDFIPLKIIDNLNTIDGVSHYNELKELYENIKKSEIEIDKLIKETSLLPSIENLTAGYKNSDLQQYHLFELGNFLSVNSKLVESEEHFPVDVEFGTISHKITEVLEKYTGNSFKTLIYDNCDKKLSSEMKGLEKRTKKELENYELKIYEKTGLKMIHPYPLLISLSDSEAEKIKKTGLLKIEPEGNSWKIDYLLSNSLKEISEKKKRTSHELKTRMKEKLFQLNSELKQYLDNFINYIIKRERRVYLYSLLKTMGDNSLCLPHFTEETEFKLEKGFLYSLKMRKEKPFVPLDIKLTKGSNILFGANMSGKTTVLKTIYFVLSLIKVGLPLPAEKISLNFPSKVRLHLKTSGSVRNDLSGFGDEINFFSEKTEDKSFILCDELFLSTDPENGVTLSKIFLEEYSGLDLVFFCSSHYPKILKNKSSSLFKMKDIPIDSIKKENFSLTDLADKMPFVVETIDKNYTQLSDTKPLELAMLFPLSDSLKSKIKQKI